MKSTELRIGNLVNQIIEHSLYNEEKVIEIEWQELMWISRDNNNKYKPIPLTEEWLFKFGFKIIINNEYNCKMYVKYFDGTDYIGVDAEDFSLGTYLNNKIAHAPRPTFMSVHQLQNLYFALTNEEL